MRISSRLLFNAFANYARLGTTFLLGIFFTWYVVGKIGMVGLGTLGLVVATFGMSAAVESALRQSLIRELAASIAHGSVDRVQRSVTAAMVFCAPAAGLSMLISLGLAGLAYVGFFNTEGAEKLHLALAALLLAEGVHMAIRLLGTPFSQALFAAQRLGVDNILRVVDRLMWVLSAVLVFGVWLPDRPLYVQLYGFAVARCTIQNLDAIGGYVFAKLLVPGARVNLRQIDWAEFRTMLSTIWHTGQVTFLMNLLDQLLAIIINLFFGLTFNGVWQIVVQVGGQARQITEGLVRGIEPLATKLQHDGQARAIVDLAVRTVRYQLTIALPMVLTYLIFLTPILNLWVRGRLSRSVDEQLAQGGPSLLDTFQVNTVEEAVSAAIQLTAIMSALQLVAIAVRVSVRGVERVLYGMGEVKSYAWFAKYATVLVVLLATTLFAVMGSPVLAPLPTLLAYLIFYQFVIPRAAASKIGYPIAAAWLQSVPRPFLAAAILACFLGAARFFLPALTVMSLLALLMGVGVVYAALLYAIILLPDERQRLRQVLVGRLQRR
jgi:hypothetical protein